MSTVYGRSVLGQTDIPNSQSYMEDCGDEDPVLAGPRVLHRRAESSGLLWLPGGNSSSALGPEEL